MKRILSEESALAFEEALCPSAPALTREILRPCPDVFLCRHLNYSEEKYRDTINAEIKQGWLALNDGKSRDPITNDRAYRKVTQRVEAKYRQLHREHRARTLLWLQSERALNLLRTKGLTPTATQDQVDEAMLRFVQQLDLTQFPEIDESMPYLDPNEYFEVSRPQLVADWGYPFYGSVVEQGAQHDSPSTKETIIGINTEFWAAFLGGDKRLGHDCVFLTSQSQFFFMDLTAGRYVPTSDEKVRLSLSQALQMRAWGQPEAVATTILEKFRTKKVMDEVLSKAKTILSADDGYFDARLRWGQKPKVNPVEVVTSFVQEHVEPADGYVMSLAECLEHLEKTCPVGLARKETVQTVNAAIRERFKKGLRHDLILGDGRGSHGWKGLRLRGSRNDTAQLDENHDRAGAAETAVESVILSV